MIPFPAVVPALALAVTLMQNPALDSMRALAGEAPDSVLVALAGRQPDEFREAVRDFLAGAVHGQSDSVRSESLTAAERVASAFAVAWRDSLLLRRVQWFRALAHADQRSAVTADSLRRAGDRAGRGVGLDSAIGLYRESLKQSMALGDTAGMAAALVSIGRAFSEKQLFDSAETILVRARAVAERAGDHRSAGRALSNLGIVMGSRGDLGRATEFFSLAAEALARSGDPRGQAAVQNNLGVVAGMRGDLTAARRAFEEGLAASRRGGDDGIAALLNLALVARREGDFEQAAVRYREAISTAREGNDLQKLIRALREFGGLEMNRGDYPRGVEALSEAADLLAHGVVGPADQIGVRVLLARGLIGRGDLQGARAELERAAAGARGRSWDVGEAGEWLAELARAQGYLDEMVNRFVEAERHYARAATLAREARDDWVRKQALVGMGSVHFRRGDYDGARRAWEAVLQDSLGRSDRAAVRLLVGHAAWRLGDTVSARRTLTDALDSLATLGSIALEAQAQGVLAEIALHGGRLYAADSLYRLALSRLADRQANVAWELHAGLGRVLARRGALDRAAEELIDAVQRVEQTASGIPLEEPRFAFLTDKWETYADLALVERARGRIEAAFEVSERLRARRLLDLLGRGRIGVPQGGRGELARREQDLRGAILELERQVDARESEPQGRRGPPGSGVPAADPQAALARSHQAYDALLIKVRAADPAYAGLVLGELAPARAVMSALAPDEALLEYLVGDSTTLVFIVTADTLAAFHANVDHAALAAQVDFVRTVLANHTGENQARTWRAPMRRLYRHLIEPVEASGLLTGKQRLIIAPHAELHYLPFAALVRPGSPERLLIEQYIIEHVPSASVWLRLRKRPRPAPRGGVLALAPRTAALPGSHAELLAIQRRQGSRARTLIGAQATESTFRSLAHEPEIIHLATFGVLNKHNPLFSYVELNPGGEYDGRLEVHEVFGLTVQARLVVLSACQTGVGAGMLSDVPAGDDWIGLVQAFLYAGAGNVLATLWPVADVATGQFMERYHGELVAGRSEAEALARVQRAALRSRATAHPFFWAGFTLVRGH